MNKVIAIVGPTASGKTKLAIELAQQNDTEIISADSRLVYRGFDIATAKPTSDEQQLVKHYMIDIVEPEFDYSVADYVEEADKCIEKLHAKNKIPIVVGGTGLYIRFLLENYKIPHVEADLKLREHLKKLSSEELYQKLCEVDEISAQNIHKNDRVRLVRALEVSSVLNKPFSDIIQTQTPKYDVEWIFPKIISREYLYENINKRVDDMVEKGLVDETRYLLNKHGRIKNLVNTIGYQEIINYLDNEISFDEAIDKIKQNTRRYAKRQLTWFRRNKELGVNI